jgi:predicted flap endonuclease-1-like 5' DNA nuclease
MKQITSLLQPLKQEAPIPWWVFWLVGATGLIVLIAIIQMRRKPDTVYTGVGETDSSGKPLTSPQTAGAPSEGTGPVTTKTSRPAGLRHETATPVETGEVTPSKPEAAEAELKTTSPDDLTAVEGVGPKISKLLEQAGITTFPQLASTRVEDLRQILQDANLHIIDPETWPEQASLAAAGKWDELSQFQSTLKGGRRRN